MKALDELLEKNRLWSNKIKDSDPEFFQRLAGQQAPTYLWVGCSDSRVPANTLAGLSPGDMFVHRNVANVVVHTDLNCLSVIQYAVEALAVKHIIVCGHYGCGGVRAALDNNKLGLIDNWLRHVQDVRDKHALLLEKITDDDRRARTLCELNVIEQVVNVCQTTIVKQAWELGQELSVHGWIYGIEDGLLRDLHIGITNQREVSEGYVAAVVAARQRLDS
jgi:carbonic anhydrase